MVSFLSVLRRFFNSNSSFGLNIRNRYCFSKVPSGLSQRGPTIALLALRWIPCCSPTSFPCDSDSAFFRIDEMVGSYKGRIKRRWCGCFLYDGGSLSPLNDRYGPTFFQRVEDLTGGDRAIGKSPLAKGRTFSGLRLSPNWAVPLEQGSHAERPPVFRDSYGPHPWIFSLEWFRSSLEFPQPGRTVKILLPSSIFLESGRRSSEFFFSFFLIRAAVAWSPFWWEKTALPLADLLTSFLVPFPKPLPPQGLHDGDFQRKRRKRRK